VSTDFYGYHMRNFSIKLPFPADTGARASSIDLS
jgi:hypothetical protein